VTRDRLTKGEIRKDALQHTVEAGAEAVAAVTTTLANAVRDVASAVGGFATEVFEIRDAARRARAENDGTVDSLGRGGPGGSGGSGGTGDAGTVSAPGGTDRD